MAAETRNLCAQIPAGLHAKVRQEQEAAGKNLSEYMTWLITEFYQTEEVRKIMNTETKTVAFQVPVELFQRFKAYLKQRGVKQNAFFLDCIQRALADAQEVSETTETGREVPGIGADGRDSEE